MIFNFKTYSGTLTILNLKKIFDPKKKLKNTPKNEPGSGSRTKEKIIPYP